MRLLNERINLKFYGAIIIKKKNSNKISFIVGKKEKKDKGEGYKRSIFEFSFDDFKMTDNELYDMDKNDYGNFINVGNGFLILMSNLQ